MRMNVWGRTEDRVEAWMEAERREEVHDRRMAGRPVCLDCKRPVAEERYFPFGEGVLCEKCVMRRMVWVEEEA